MWTASTRCWTDSGTPQTSCGSVSPSFTSHPAPGWARVGPDMIGLLRMLHLWVHSCLQCTHVCHRCQITVVSVHNHREFVCVCVFIAFAHVYFLAVLHFFFFSTERLCVLCLCFSSVLSTAVFMQYYLTICPPRAAGHLWIRGFWYQPLRAAVHQFRQRAAAAPLQHLCVPAGPGTGLRLHARVHMHASNLRCAHCQHCARLESAPRLLGPAYHPSHGAVEVRLCNNTC